MKLFLRIVMFVQLLLIILGVFDLYIGETYFGLFHIIFNSFGFTINIINLKKINQ
jgi:hypothetical protein